ncbi:unnamed protein product [Pleuronectes platessa]|uniref:Uncharacterized protein n=1 Tax=Pleuronectes platessa TaxID=8262 RepID=A0A9N7YP50_PLEPL|nr:unnamed protein product [Pleuronectes platessa]
MRRSFAAVSRYPYTLIGADNRPENDAPAVTAKRPIGGPQVAWLPSIPVAPSPLSPFTDCDRQPRRYHTLLKAAEEGEKVGPSGVGHSRCSCLSSVHECATLIDFPCSFPSLPRSGLSRLPSRSATLFRGTVP